MPVMCAFLRGVNVNGRSMKMAEVCEVFSQKVGHVQSVLAAGNILFETDREKDVLRDMLEQALSAHYASDVYLFVKTKEEIGRMAAGSPFAADERLHVYAFICEQGFENELLERFATIRPLSDERAAVSDGCFYWQVSKGQTLDSGFSKTLAEKRFRSRITSRNLNTIRKIADVMEKEYGGGV